MAMSTFIGPRDLPLSGYEVSTIDDKGRILLPKSMRDGVGERFAVMIGRKGCLEIVSEDRFQAAWAKIQEACLHSEYAQEYAGLVYGDSFSGLKFDTAGRFVVPIPAREKAGLKNEIYIRGAGGHVEIWDLAEFRKYEADMLNYNKSRREQFQMLKKLMAEEIGP